MNVEQFIGMFVIAQVVAGYGTQVNVAVVMGPLGEVMVQHGPKDWERQAVERDD